MKRGFTLVELMIVLVIVALLASILGGAVRGCANGTRGRQRAADDAAHWVRRNHPDWTNTRITCTSVPTNGMVECDVVADLPSVATGIEVTLSCAHTVAREDTRVCHQIQTHH